MPRVPARYLTLLALVALPASASAQAAPTDPACATVRVALPAELAGWSQQQPVSAGTKPGEGATVSVGQAALVSLHPARHLALAPAAKAADGNGGTLSLAITAPGTYRIALGGKAWVDLVQAGKPVASVAHAHGPRCSGVQKMVDFKLAPGTYAIQLSGSPDETIALLAAKLA